MGSVAMLGMLAAATVIALGRKTPAVCARAWQAAGPLMVPALAALLCLGAMLWLAGAVVDVRDYLLNDLGVATAGFGLLWLIALRFETATARIATSLLRLPAMAWACFAMVAALAAQQFVLEDVPHATDEVAYQFQAQALASGRLGFQPPEHLDFFHFTHVSDAGGLWHGIMPPGWPALLAIGEVAGARQLVNPLLAAAALLLLDAAARRARIGRTARQISIFALAISPFYVFLAGSYMSHSANLFLFALFLYAWTRWTRHQAGVAIGWAVLAGIALGLNATVRSLDSLVAATPFVVWEAWRALRLPRRWPALIALASASTIGVAALLAYNNAITGDPLSLPQVAHFQVENAGERFGFGFGADMGTKIHGPQWPGYYLSDAPRVTSQRLLQWLKDLHGVPLVLLAALFALFRAPGKERIEGPRQDAPLCGLLLASSAALVVVYLAHFYHGIAYGSRHYALALPGVVLALSVAGGRLLDAGGAGAVATRAACLALLAHTALFALPPLTREYGTHYLWASASIRDAVEREHLSHALVFVTLNGGWKSAFPQNHFPLETSDVVFARDLGPRNRVLRRAFPDRPAFRVRMQAEGPALLSPMPPLARSSPAAGLLRPSN